jgi:sulfate adenylyltransferase subunit 1 (EFTu-like GTPase family)
VAYRYFATPKRKFIIADAPGHVQHTRNVSPGLYLRPRTRPRRRPQGPHRAVTPARRDPLIPHLVLAVNKMDLVRTSVPPGREQPAPGQGDQGAGSQRDRRVQLRTTAPPLCDPYSKNRTTGSFILIDEATGVTVGAGMINSGS